MAGTRRERPASTAAARRLKTIDVETTSFFDALWPALAAGVIAGLVVLGVGYLLIEKRLRLHERAENERQTRKAFLQIVLAELLHNAGHLTTFVEELPEMLVPAPGFELGGWALVSQERALLTIREETASKLLHAYGRMRSANDLRDQLVDLINGTSALTVRIADASAPSGSAAPRRSPPTCSSGSGASEQPARAWPRSRRA